MTLETMTPSLADYKARCFVNGVRRHAKSGNLEPAGGQFSERFLSHPWVRESITEGWGRELRGHLIQAAKIRLMRGEPIGDIENLMPSREWVDAAKTNAERYRKAAAWRASQGAPLIDSVGLMQRLGVVL